MSSYHSSFTYHEQNSFNDKNLLITAFDPDDGFMDAFLSTENISDDYYDGTKKFTYGARYNTSAEIQITVIKSDKSDFSIKEFRDCARWLTGARIDSWLDLYAGDKFVYSFLGKFTNLEHYKLDGRIIGLRATFSSISPWAWSAPQVFDCTISQLLDIAEDGTLYKSGENAVPLGINDDGVLCVNYMDTGSYFNVTDDGIVYIDNAYRTTINNQSDDLYTYIYLDIDYINKNSTFVSINNKTLGEEALVENMGIDEKISISAKQFILSSVPNKVFGNSFNFVWPRLAPGLNDFMVEGNGGGTAQFTYRYPMKVGDCAMDITVYGGDGGCGNVASYDTIKWEDIIGAPTSLSGYGITDAYTKDEVYSKNEVYSKEDVCSKDETYSKDDVYNKDEVYAKTETYNKDEVYTTDEVDDKIENIEVSGGGTGGSVAIDEQELNEMLEDILG